jgi:hypothetical protein
VFLTADQLHELTGFRRPSAQIRWLRDNHWAFAVRADGKPSVAEREFEAQMCTGQKAAATDEPDFAALDKAG